MTTLTAATQQLKQLVKQRTDLEKQQAAATRYETALQENEADIEAAKLAMQQAAYEDAIVKLGELRKLEGALLADFDKHVAAMAAFEQRGAKLRDDIRKLTGPFMSGNITFGNMEIGFLRGMEGICYRATIDKDHLIKGYTRTLKNHGYRSD